jgi:selenophosphate synthase
MHEIWRNILLKNSLRKLKIWQEKIQREATITITVFNSSKSTSSIKVIVTRNIGEPVDFTASLRNTLSATIEDAKTITVMCKSAVTDICEGEFCLEVCHSS